MVHLFTFAQDRLAFDSESGALYLLDEVSYAVLEALIAADSQDLKRIELPELATRFGETAVHEALIEISQLIENGSMFAPTQEVSLEQLYPEKPLIKSMCLHISHDCNLRCRYCFAGTGDFGTGKRSMLTEETGRKAIDWLIAGSGSRRNLDIDFFGGEPLINWPVVVALTHYAEEAGSKAGKNIRLTITTNAIQLDAEKTAFINEHMKNCVLSIDGRPEVHDRMRPDAGGKGSYERVMNSIRNFIAERGDKEYYARGTFTRHNLDFAADVMHLADQGIDQISLEPVVAAAGCGYELRQEDVPAILAEYEKLALDYAARREAGKPFNFFHFMIDTDHGPCAYKRLKGCGVGSEYCAVTPDGDIYPCHQFVGQEEFCLGNVHTEPVMLDADLTAAFSKLMVPNKPDCQNCWSRYFCSGGCAANAYAATGRIDGLHKISCELQKKRLECALWLKVRAAQQDEATEKAVKIEEQA